MHDDQTGGSAAERLSRRRLLALTGTGALGGIAGCGGGDSEATPTTERPTTEPTAAPATPTQTETPTARATTERDVEALLEEYRCPGRNDEFDLVVAKDGSGDVETVQAAFDAVPAGEFEETRIFVEAGTYEEKLQLPPNKIDVTLVGGDPEETVLTYDDHARKTDESGSEIGTSGSSSFFCRGLNFTAQNVTFENAAEPVAQAVAIRVDGDRAVFENCRFLGNQDTLYTYGRGSRQYYRDCYVEGDVDFVFGSSTALFENCRIHCTGNSGYVTAASTPEDEDYGYVFTDCEVTGDAPDDSFYLGRPWRPYAKTVFVNTYLGDHVRPEGWHNWNEPEKEETVYYAEYDNEGPGYAPGERVPWSHQLSDGQAAAYTIEEIFDGWNPRACLEESGDA